MAIFTDVFEDVTKRGTKLQTSEYKTHGKYVIIDQGQSEFAGYTDREDGLYTDVPIIVFGDHTRVIKYIDKPCFLGADGVKLLKAKTQDPNYKYLFYALSHADIPNTGYNRHFKWLKEIDIALPDVSEQEHIVSVLDRISDFINAHQQQISKLDELVKSRFIELFGDPMENPLGWGVGTMKSVCAKITDGEHGSVPRSVDGYPFLNAKHIKKEGYIDWGTVSYVSEEIHTKIYSRCNPESGDILLTTTGTIGNVAICPKGIVFSMDRGITLLKLKCECLDTQFIAWLLRFDSIQSIMNANVHASAIGHLFLNQVQQLPVIVPPLELQKQFAAFVEQIDKLKLEVKQSLEKLETLKKSLLQEYFG